MMKRITALILAALLLLTLAACGGAQEAETETKNTAASAAEAAAEPEASKPQTADAPREETVPAPETESPAPEEKPAPEKEPENPTAAPEKEPEKPAPAPEKEPEKPAAAPEKEPEKPAPQPQPEAQPAPAPAPEPQPEPEQTPAPEAEPADDAQLPPDFTLVDQYGKTHRLSDYRGKVVFLNFWATWCPYCLQEMPDIQAIYAARNPDVVILGIAATGDGGEPEGTVRAYLTEHGYTYPTLMDVGGSVAATYGARALPTTFLFAKDGTLFGYIPGMMTAETMQRAIDQALAAG